MGLLERIEQAWQRDRPGSGELAWPVGRGTVDPWDRFYGHDGSRSSPESYGDYLATSNEIYAAASLRARLMASLRLRLYRGDDANKRELAQHPAAKLLRFVNPFWSAERLARMDELSMCLWGASCWAVEPGPDGQPADIWWLKPSRVRPVPDERRYLAGFLYDPPGGGQLIPFRPSEIVWFRYPNPADEFAPLSPLAAARLAADTSGQMMRANAELFKQGLLAGGLVVPDSNNVTFSPDQAKELETLLERRFSGLDAAHRWSVLRYVAKFQDLAVTPKDAEWAVGLGLTGRQVWNAYGIPAPLLNDLEHATLANLEQLTLVLWEHALIPDSTYRAAEIREQYLPLWSGRGRGAPPDWCEYDYSSVPVLQKAASEAWEREGAQIDRGALTINEWRQRNGLPPVAWGDVFWAPVNKAPVADGQTIPAQISSPDEPAPADGDPTGQGGNPDAASPPAPSLTGGPLEPGPLLAALDDYRRLAGRPLAGVGGRNGHSP